MSLESLAGEGCRPLLGQQSGTPVSGTTKGASFTAMPDRTFPSTAIALALSLGGCSADIQAPTAQVPVVQSLLVARDSLQTVWVEYRLPADSGFGPGVRPVPPALVQLSLILPDSSSVSFTPAPVNPGRFDAAVTVDPGGHYRLTGTVTGIPVSAETTVPDSLDIRVPLEDTVSIAGSCGFCPLPYRWFAGGAEAYFYHLSETHSLFNRGGSTRDTTGVLRLLEGQGTTHLTVFALDAHAASFLLPTTPRSSIAGVFGLFGSASRAERWILWQ
ncbi:MAG: hypothetical protein ACREMW_04135 [Gemmatimonadales bacterium]